MRNIRKYITAATVCIIGLVALIAWATQDLVPLGKFRQIEIGMTQSQVQALIGSPRRTRLTDIDNPRNPGQIWWSYDRPLTLVYCYVAFSTNGTVVGFNYEGNLPSH